MISTVPGATDVCICGHAGVTHNASQVCRFQKDPTSPCGCVSFGYPGNMGTNPSALATPALATPALVGNRNL